MRFKARLNGDAEVIRLLARFPQRIGRTMASLVKQEARALAVELARTTRPYGFSEAARKVGEGAVAKDVRKVFATPEEAFTETGKADPEAADRFWAHVQNRRFARARKALAASASPWAAVPVGRLDPAHHSASRKGGKVVRTRQAQVVTSRKSLEAYIARVQSRVGFAKGVWINAAKAIGGRVRGAAKWAMRHRQAPGTAKVRTGDRPSVTLVSRLDYMDDVTTESGIKRSLAAAASRLRIALATSLRVVQQRTQRSLQQRAG
jgi:hypothetical protein